MSWIGCLLGTLTLLAGSLCAAQVSDYPGGSSLDSDRDGFSDGLEQRLLEQFRPEFLVGRTDCSHVPAEFATGVSSPQAEMDDGTIYGQVFPAKDSTGSAPVAEIHYYHLWARDCGGHGHPLDTEHVSVLVRASGSDPATAMWKAEYWYAAAHENTVCDVSQIARASTLHAEEHGARIWISPGKHASYLNATLCQRGCGADRCMAMVPLTAAKIVNLGEPGRPMNGSLFIGSDEWPLAGKMAHTNFPAAPVARLNQLPDGSIAFFNAGRHPAQGIIAISSTTEQALAAGQQSTGVAVSTAGGATGDALAAAGDSTGGALQKSYRGTRHALGTSARHVGSALHLTRKQGNGEPQ